MDWRAAESPPDPPRPPTIPSFQTPGSFAPQSRAPVLPPPRPTPAPSLPHEHVTNGHAWASPVSPQYTHSAHRNGAMIDSRNAGPSSPRVPSPRHVAMMRSAYSPVAVPAPYLANHMAGVRPVQPQLPVAPLPDPCAPVLGASSPGSRLGPGQTSQFQSEPVSSFVPSPPNGSTPGVPAPLFAAGPAVAATSPLPIDLTNASASPQEVLAPSAGAGAGAGKKRRRRHKASRHEAEGGAPLSRRQGLRQISVVDWGLALMSDSSDDTDAGPRYAVPPPSLKRQHSEAAVAALPLPQQLLHPRLNGGHAFPVETVVVFNPYVAPAVGASQVPVDAAPTPVMDAPMPAATPFLPRANGMKNGVGHGAPADLKAAKPKQLQRPTRALLDASWPVHTSRAEEEPFTGGATFDDPASSYSACSGESDGEGSCSSWGSASESEDDIEAVSAPGRVPVVLTSVYKGVSWNSLEHVWTVSSRSIGLLQNDTVGSAKLRCERDAALTMDLSRESRGLLLSCADRNIVEMCSMRHNHLAVQARAVARGGVPTPHRYFGWCNGCDGTVCSQRADRAFDTLMSAAAFAPVAKLDRQRSTGSSSGSALPAAPSAADCAAAVQRVLALGDDGGDTCDVEDGNEGPPEGLGDVEEGDTALACGGEAAVQATVDFPEPKDEVMGVDGEDAAVDTSLEASHSSEEAAADEDDKGEAKAASSLSAVWEEMRSISRTKYGREPVGHVKNRKVWWCDHCAKVWSPDVSLVARPQSVTHLCPWFLGLDDAGVQVFLCQDCGEHFALHAARRDVVFAPGDEVLAAIRSCLRSSKAAKHLASARYNYAQARDVVKTQAERLSHGRVALKRCGLLGRDAKLLDNWSTFPRPQAISRVKIRAERANVVGDGMFWVCGARSRRFVSAPFLASVAERHAGALKTRSKLPHWDDAWNASRSMRSSKWHAAKTMFAGEEDDGAEDGVWTYENGAGRCVCPAWSDDCACAAKVKPLGRAPRPDALKPPKAVAVEAGVLHDPRFAAQVPVFSARPVKPYAKDELQKLSTVSAAGAALSPRAAWLQRMGPLLPRSCDAVAASPSNKSHCLPERIMYCSKKFVKNAPASHRSANHAKRYQHWVTALHHEAAETKLPPNSSS